MVNAASLIVSSAITLNTVYLAAMLYGIPEYIPLIFLPIIVGIGVSRLIRDAKRSLLATILFVLLVLMLMSVTLLLPVFAGVFTDEGYADIFSFKVMLKVFGNIFVIGFHSLISNLVGILIWGSE
ncbi:MAG: hypothetical protein AOA65_1427 [Candidatus Bathyarchaeota archaeon BA1]|nr:MAG: hypothetical protein AOA65_1427 [Candidatus Bathyarchaeota archaeon BA1]